MTPQLTPKGATVSAAENPVPPVNEDPSKPDQKEEKNGKPASPDGSGFAAGKAGLAVHAPASSAP